MERSPSLGGRAAVLSVALAVCTALAAQAAAPRAHLVNRVVNLGERTRIQEAVGRFEIRNEGDAPLRILDAKPSCGCTVVSFDGEIAPGESGFLEATVDIATVRGPVWNQIYVETNDPLHPKLLLDLHTLVVGGVKVLPGEDVYLRNRAGHLPSARVVLRKEADEEGELAIANVESTQGWLRARAVPIEKAAPAGDGLPETFEGDWLVELAVVGEPAYGRSEEGVWFDTGLPREPQVMVPVVLELLPPVNVSARRIDLSPSEPRQTIVLSTREGAEPAWLRVEAMPPTLSARLEELGGRYFKLHVEASAALVGIADAAILLHVGQETMRVPVAWSEPVPATR